MLINWLFVHHKSKVRSSEVDCEREKVNSSSLDHPQVQSVTLVHVHDLEICSFQLKVFNRELTLPVCATQKTTSDRSTLNLSRPRQALASSSFQEPDLSGLRHRCLGWLLLSSNTQPAPHWGLMPGTFSAFLRARVCNTIILATNCATSGDKLAPKLIGITTYICKYEVAAEHEFDLHFDMKRTS